MNVLLIIPPPASTEYPSLGVASIAGAVKQAGYNVDVLDLNLFLYKSEKIMGNTWQKEGFDRWCSESFCHSHWPVLQGLLDRQLEDRNRLRKEWQCIGLHVNYASKINASLIVKYLRSLFPTAKVAVGGPAYFCERDLDHSINTFDAIFQGEAEKTFVQWLTSDVNIRNGLSVSQNIIPAPHSPLNLDNLPEPFFKPFPLSDYARKGVLPIETGRGCTNRCAFCEDSKMWGKYRRKGRKRIEIDINTLTVVKATHISFADSILNPGPDHFDQLLDLLIATDHSWDGMIQARGIDSKIAKKMKTSGCSDVFIGVESFNRTLLEKFNKYKVSGKSEATITILAENGIHVSIGVIIAGPPLQTRWQFEQDKQSLMKMSKFIKSVAVNPLYIPPNTPLWHNSSHIGISGLTNENGWKFWHAGNGISDIELRFNWCFEMINFLKTIGISSGANYSDFESYKKHQLSTASKIYGTEML